MSDLRLNMNVTIDYVTNGTDKTELKNNLLEIMQHAYGDGCITGALDAEVEELLCV